MALFGFGKDEDERRSSRDVREAEAPVSTGMIWICEKCGYKLSDSDHDSPARSLQKAIKSRISENKRKREVRALVTSCMNICPSKKIAVALADLKGGKVRFLELAYQGDVERSADELYRLL